MSANALRQSAARMTTSQTRVSTDPQLNACESAFAISPGCGAAAPGFRVHGSTIVQTSFHPLFYFAYMRRVGGVDGVGAGSEGDSA
jgi:hypothetical protein